MTRTNFFPTPEQQGIIEQAKKYKAEARVKGKPVSQYFIDKCSSEQGIEKPHNNAKLK